MLILVFLSFFATLSTAEDSPLNYVYARKLYVQNPGNRHMGLSRINIYNTSGIDLTLDPGVIADASSIYNNDVASWGPQLLLTDPGLAHTQGPAPEWFSIEFPEEKEVSTIRLVNRAVSGCCGSRILTSVVRLENTAGEVVWYSPSIDTPQNTYDFQVFLTDAPTAAPTSAPTGAPTIYTECPEDVKIISGDLAVEAIGNSSFPGSLSRGGYARVRDNDMILVGGFDGSGNPSAKGWWFHFGDRSWTSLPSGPSGRILPCMAYNHLGNEVYFFGGQDSSHSFQNDLWVITLVEPITWREMSCAENCPAARFAASLHFSSTFSEIILFGGHATVGLLNDVQVFSTANETWRESIARSENGREVSGSQPSARSGFYSAFDDVSGILWIYGGHSLNIISAAGPRNDFWELRYKTLEFRKIGGDETLNTFPNVAWPGGIKEGSLIYDTVRNRLILSFGVNFAAGNVVTFWDRIYAFDISLETWKVVIGDDANRIPTATSLGGRYGPAVVLNEKDNILSTFGGISVAGNMQAMYEIQLCEGSQNTAEEPEEPLSFWEELVAHEYFLYGAIGLGVVSFMAASGFIVARSSKNTSGREVRGKGKKRGKQTGGRKDKRKRRR